jgi:hypothetical protein
VISDEDAVVGFLMLPGFMPIMEISFPGSRDSKNSASINFIQQIIFPGRLKVFTPGIRNFLNNP